jgi:O-antigen/teichoic acid export membrane protein
MVSAVFSQTLTVQNRQRRTLVVRLLGLAINVALALTWLPQLGALGAARAVLVSELAVAACLALAANLPARWWRTMANRLARLAIAAGVLSAGLWWLAPWGFIGSAALALALYAAALFASRAISNRDWALIRRLPAAWRTASDLAQPSPERMG